MDELLDGWKAMKWDDPMMPFIAGLILVACVLLLFGLNQLISPIVRRYRRGKLMEVNGRQERINQRNRQRVLKNWACKKITDAFEDGYAKDEITRAQLQYLYNFIGKACNLKGLLPQRVRASKLNHLDKEMLKIRIEASLANGEHKPVKLSDTKLMPRNKLQEIMRRSRTAA